MGLMLSVLVFCVGVAEMMDWWHHLLLFLVQPQHNPLPYRLDPNADILSEREHIPLYESGRSSKVDICWPKDLSPNDNLHVIKKRSHSETERKHDQDKELMSHHSTRSVFLHDKNPDPSQLDVVTNLTPTIEIHHVEDDRNESSPVTSRENSPGLLELDVIVESDSSSEFEELSQIENLAYVKKQICAANLESLAGSEDCVVDVSGKQSTEYVCNEELPSDSSKVNEPEDCLARPTSLNLSSIVGTSKREIQITQGEELNDPIPDKTDLPLGLPTVTHSDSKDTAKTTPEGENQSSISLEQRGDLVQTKNFVSEDISEPSEAFYSSSETQSDPLSQNIEHSDNLLIHSCKVGPSTEIPEVTLRESSPVPLEESTDSSLNTSDASWMVRSRTSDRPLVIRFNPEEVASDFMSVTKTDLQAFDNKHTTVEASTRDAKESDNVVSDSKEQSSGKGTGSRERPLQTPQTLHDLVEPNGQEVSNDMKRDSFVEWEEHKTSTQLETNSSSSSLSGIPQLPEDIRDNQTNTSLPSDNGYGNSSLQTQGDHLNTLDSGSDYLVQTSSDSFGLDVVCELQPEQSIKDTTSEKSEKNNLLNTENSSIDLENARLNKPSDSGKTENLENVCVQPLAVSLQDKLLNDHFSRLSLESLSNPLLLETQSSVEQPIVKAKTNICLKTDESQTSKSIPESFEPCFFLPDDKITKQSPVKSEPLEQETIDNTRCELEKEQPDADFKHKPLQRRDTKRKSKITPRTFSRENSSKSDDSDVLCHSNETSETDNSKNQATSVSLRTSPNQSEKEDSANPPPKDKQGPSNPPCTVGSSDLPSQDKPEVTNIGYCI